MISIIIPTLNNRVFLQQAVESIIRNTSDYELIIINNNSTDDTNEYLKSPSLSDVNGQLVVNKENKGFGIACNQGAKVAKSDTLIFLNNDTIATPEWANNLIKCHKEEQCGIVGAKLIYPGTGLIQHCGIVERDDGMPSHIYHNRSRYYKPANKRKEYFAVTGACMLISKKLFWEVGGFDTRYWCGWEDIALNQSVRKKGYSVFYEPTAELYHYESRTEGRYSAENSNFNIYMNDWYLNKDKNV